MATRPDPDPRNYAYDVIASKIDRGFTLDQILDIQGGSYTPAGAAHPDDPHHGYTIGMSFNHLAPRLPNGNLRTLKHGQIGVFIGDDCGEYSIQELVREVNAGVRQSRLL